MSSEDEEFYVRYYVGHKGKFGHEFLEFEFRPDGRLRYANNSNYKNDKLINSERVILAQPIYGLQLFYLFLLPTFLINKNYFRI